MHKSKLKYTIFALLASILTLGSVSCDSKRKLRPGDWIPKYYNTDTKPYDTYITYRLLDSIFVESEITTTRKSVVNQINDIVGSYDYRQTYDPDLDEYVDVEEIVLDDEFLEEMYNKLLSRLSRYIFIDNAFLPTKDEVESMCDFVGGGHEIFVSAECFNDDFLSALSLYSKSRTVESINDTTYVLKDSSSKEYSFSKFRDFQTLELDSCTLPYKVLAENKSGDISFVAIKYGYGYFYIHTVPAAFTNFYVLDKTRYDFAFRSLSYMDDIESDIYWDEYYKKGAYDDRENDIGMFAHIFKSRALSLAFFLALAGMFLFILFRGKRSQRIIPIIAKPKNTSLEFLGMISNMYLKKKDYMSIVEKRHSYFLDFIRRNYYLSTEEITKDFKESLSAKTAVSVFIINDIFSIYDYTRNSEEISKDNFEKYNKQLEAFYKIVKTN